MVLFQERFWWSFFKKNFSDTVLFQEKFWWWGEKFFSRRKHFLAITDNFTKHILSRKLKNQLFFILFFLLVNSVFLSFRLHVQVVDTKDKRSFLQFTFVDWKMWNVTLIFFGDVVGYGKGLLAGSANRDLHSCGQWKANGEGRPSITGRKWCFLTFILRGENNNVENNGEKVKTWTFPVFWLRSTFTGLGAGVEAVAVGTPLQSI